MAKKELLYYRIKSGKEPLREWLKSFRDKMTRARIERRIERMKQDYYGDYKAVNEGVSELRFFFGAGYRVYFAEDGDTVVLLLHGGDKSSQRRDIKTAQAYWQEYQEDKR